MDLRGGSLAIDGAVAGVPLLLLLPRNQANDGDEPTFLSTYY